MKSLEICDYQHGVLWPYFPKSGKTRKGIWNCPSDLIDGRPPLLGSAQNNVVRNFTYTYNAGINWDPRMCAYDQRSGGTSKYSTLRLTQIKHPGQKLFIVEEKGANDCCFWCITPDTDDQPAERTRKWATSAWPTATSRG